MGDEREAPAITPVLARLARSFLIKASISASIMQQLPPIWSYDNTQKRFCKTNSQVTVLGNWNRC